jgi:ABC-type Mn2+/Zn2+ transport system permease subunit
MLIIAVGSGVGAGAVGLLVSYHAGLPAGPTVAITAVGLIGIAALWVRPVRAMHRTVRRADRHRREVT